MPKLIVASRYLRCSDSSKKKNYTKYIATRETVEFREQNKENPQAPATQNQQGLVLSLLSDFPEARKYIEYEDYKNKNTVENATELINTIIERNADIIGNRQNFVGYMAMRPGVEKRGSHGLFTSSDEPIVLSKVATEVANHKGNVWSHVISLRREDAVRLGYDNSERWRELVKRHISDIAEQSRIPLCNLKWYAAYHDTTHHPHIHLLVYSENPKQGYLTSDGIRKIKSVFANDIFHDDLQSIYEEQTVMRNELKEEARKQFEEFSVRIKSDNYDNPELNKLVYLLYCQLKSTNGKKVYGYLMPEIKSTVNEIFKELSTNKNISALYEKWCELERQKIKAYTFKEKEFPPMYENKVFNSVRNMIIQNVSALNPPPPLLARMNLTDKEIEIHDEICLPSDEEMPENLMESTTDYQATTEHFHIRWSTDYTKACSLLYDKRSAKDDYLKAEKLLVSESEKQNILAIHDLGKFFSTDKFGRKDDEKSFEYYKKALNGFMKIEPKSNSLMPYEQKYPSQIMKPVDMRSYVWYRIGKMHCYGLGTNCDFEKSFEWFQKSAKEGNKFAQFGLANQYYYGNGVEKDLEKAFHWYTKSALQGQPYAAFSVAKFYENGEIFEKSDKLANQYYAQALAGFMKIVKEEQADDNLFYKLGFMYKKGLGTEVDMKTAYDYFKQSADLNNKNALYEYGKALLTGTDIEKDIPKAMECLEKSAELGNEYAQYVIDNFHAYENATLSSCVIGLFSGLCSCIADDYSHKFKDNRRTVDRKLRKVIQRQKREMGIKLEQELQ